MFRKLLIANRGEIACRVIRTARRLGIPTVAIYSEADARALHVETADEAVLIGPPPARDSYLRGDRIVAAARRTGAEAVHPGYGFLAENADFAEACAAAGLVFVGPPAAAIRAMGSKTESKRLLAPAGVPLVPGYHGDDQSEAALQEAAQRIGFPVLIKASAGGGGKGMRRVDGPAELPAALASAKREALSAFADDRMLLEKYLLRPRHIEVQVFADRHGGVMHLFERDCSIQRRHQKVVEEAPGPGIAPALRGELGATAVTVARVVGYEGAGTVEFIMDEDGRFYFMEMNTRLQVEHPVTEMVTGLDLVEWQLRVAAGEPLPASPDQVSLSGHAIEVRLYAEDPERDFLPASGRLRHLHFPEQGADVRIDTGVRQGDEVSIHYDPMLAKIIVRGETRDAAVARLRAALAAVEIVGPPTNLGLLRAIAAHPAYGDGALDTGFIERHREELRAPAAALPREATALACVYLLLQREARAGAAAARSADPTSPWHDATGWRLNQPAMSQLELRTEAGLLSVVAEARGGGFDLANLDGRIRIAAARLVDGGVAAEIEGRRLRAAVLEDEMGLDLILGGVPWRFDLLDPVRLTSDSTATAGRLTAPMPGKVVQVFVAPGTAVRRGQALMILEAMKMEHTIAAPVDGVLAAVRYAAGDLVEEGVELLSFAQG